jgi:hypothetical protein
MTVNPSLPTPMQILNAFDGVSLEQLQIIIQELRDAAANDDDQDSSGGAQKAPAQQKEPILEL